MPPNQNEPNRLVPTRSWTLSMADHFIDPLIRRTKGMAKKAATLASSTQNCQPAVGIVIPAMQ